MPPVCRRLCLARPGSIVTPARSSRRCSRCRARLGAVRQHMVLRVGRERAPVDEGRAELAGHTAPLALEQAPGHLPGAVIAAATRDACRDGSHAGPGIRFTLGHAYNRGRRAGRRSRRPRVKRRPRSEPCRPALHQGRYVRPRMRTSRAYRNGSGGWAHCWARAPVDVDSCAGSWAARRKTMIASHAGSTAPTGRAGSRPGWTSILRASRPCGFVCRSRHHEEQPILRPARPGRRRRSRDAYALAEYRRSRGVLTSAAALRALASMKQGGAR
jgi:hypothetical protein